MRFSVVFDPVQDPGFATGYYYAHVPALGLTTHGLGIDGARTAAAELVKAWVAEKRAAGEPVPASTDSLFGTLEISEDALQSA